MPSIKYKKKTYAGATFPVLEMTKAEYDALPEAKKMDGTVYMITDDTGGWEAERSVYDNTESGLTATNVQDALDEIAGDVSELNSKKAYQSITDFQIVGNVIDSVRIGVENEMVFLSVSIKAQSTTLGWDNGSGILINDKYHPRMELMGARRISASADSTVAAFCDIYHGSNNTLAIQTFIGAPTIQLTTFSFVYPMRQS